MKITDLHEDLKGKYKTQFVVSTKQECPFTFGKHTGQERKYFRGKPLTIHGMAEALSAYK